MIPYLNSVIKKLIMKTDSNTREISKMKEIRSLDNARIKLYKSKVNHLL